MARGSGENQIKKTETMKPVEVNKTGESFDIKNSRTLPASDMPEFGDIFGKTEKKEKTEKKNATTKDLKKKAEDLPVKEVKQTKPAKSVQKSKTTSKTNLESAKNAIRDLHKELDAEEKSSFSKNELQEIRRNHYEELSASDIKKRAQNALKRKDLAARITKYESSKKNYRYTHIDRERLIEKIALFKQMRSVPYDMSDDEDFVENLEKNYGLCETADRMSHWIGEAVEAGFMPEGEDMAALQEKIENFAEIKRYLDTQCDLIKNPYYQYMAKDDVSYTDNQIEHFLSKSHNETLKGYLSDIRVLRKLNFVRSKGMKSSSDYAQKEGKRKAEILATRNEKLDIISKFKDTAINYAGNKRFLDKDYDSRFTKKLFEESLAGFKAMDIKSLHFESIKDIAEHFDENQHMFDRVHDMEHLILVAIQRGMAPSDNELIELRSKIEAFTLAERMAEKIREQVLVGQRAFLKDMTNKECEDKVFTAIKEFTDKHQNSAPPRIGSDLSKYLDSITRKNKKDHKNREKNIRLVYGATHAESDEDGFKLGEIPAEELTRRKADYQKNMFGAYHIRSLETYIQNISGSRLSSIAAIHAEKTGRPVFDTAGPTMQPYLVGKTADEVIRVIDIMQTGSAEEKEKLWTAIAKEAMATDVNELDTRDPKVFYSNVAYRMRIQKIFGNLGGSASEFPQHIHDDELLKKNEAYYSTGRGNLYLSSMAQAVVSDEVGALDLDDWFTANTDNLLSVLDEIGESGENTKTFRLHGKNETMTAEHFKILETALRNINFMRVAGMSEHHTDRSRKGIRDNAVVFLYDEMKAMGAVNAVTDEDISEITKFYDFYTKQDKAEREKLKESILKEMQKEDPAHVMVPGTRLALINNVSLLNKDAEDVRIAKSTALYKGLVLTQNKTDAASKQLRAESIEEIFRAVMAFDISKFEFKSYKDIVSDPARYEECCAASSLAQEVVNYINDYKNLRVDEEVRTKLRGVHVDEIQARCDLLMKGQVFFDKIFNDILTSPELKKTGKSFDDVMHLMPEEIQANLAAAKTDDQKKFWTNVWSTTQALGGYDIAIPLSTLENGTRAARGLYDKSRSIEALNILNGTESVLQEVKDGKIKFSYLPENALMSRFVPVFKEKDYTVSERESKLFNKKSRLYGKRLVSDKLIQKTKDYKDIYISSKGAINIKNRIAIGEKDLEHLSAFMEGDATIDNSLAEQYANKETRFDMLDALTMELMETSLDVDVLSDADFAENASKLEVISKKAQAYNALLKANPEYEKRLMNRVPGNSLSDLERVTMHLDHMLAISDYYRARKALLTDTYYVLHYDDEISASRDTGSNEDQKRVADLIALVTQCARRLSGGEFRSREDSGIERVLDKAESMGRQNAYLTGRPDLTKADPESVHKANKEIEKYLEEVGLNNLQRHEIATSDDKVPFPEAEKYRTANVKNYFDAVKTYARFADPSYKEKPVTPERKELLDKLYRRLVDKNGDPVSHPTFNDPVTGEKWTLTTDIQRMPMFLCAVYGGDLSNEEIIDIFEGLLVTYRNDIDLTKEDQRQYARNRFLTSLQKIFRLEYENVKRYENTYGTLSDEIPFGVFMMSMGGGQKDLILRNLFGQDLANLCDTDAERDSISDGKKLTTAELLVKYGMITEEEMRDAVNLGPKYYQPINGQQNDYIFSINDYHPDKNMRPKNKFISTSSIEALQYNKDHSKIKGPGLSQAEARNIWKKTLKYKDDNVLTGGNLFLTSQRDKLDLYTPAEKRELKQQRKKDAGIMSLYNAYLDEREEVLLKKTRAAVGDGISDELLKKLIVFHPGMLKHGKTSSKTGEAAVTGTDAFYANVIKFAGIGIAEDKKEAARKEALGAFLRSWDELFRYRRLVDSIDRLMDGDPDDSGYQEARKNASEIKEGSRLLAGEVRHRMFESVKLLSADPDIYGLLSDKELKSIREHTKNQLGQEILRKLITNSFYLDLKDIGSRRQSYPEKMHQEILKISRDLSNGRFDLGEALKDDDFTGYLKYFGIGTDDVKLFFASPADTSKLQKLNVDGVEVDEKLFEEALDESKLVFEDESEEAVKEEKKEESKQSGEEHINMDEEIAAQQQQNLHYEVPAIEYAQNVTAPEKGVHTAYEKQGRGTSYCWACAMSGLMNAFAGKKVSQLSDIKKRPLAIPTFEQSGVQNRKTYDDGVALVNSMYSGNEYGNPAIFGDYIQQKLPNAAVRTAIVSREAGRLDYCKRRFLETLSKNLEKGPVGMLTGGHFVLVKELRGDRLMVNNSLSADPDTLEDYGSSISQLFASSGQQVELVWLEDMNGREGEIAQQFDLNYNAEAKEFSFKNQGDVIANAPEQASYKQVHNEQTILHKNGIEASTQLYDDVVFNFVYLPKKLQALGQNPQGPVPQGPAPVNEEPVQEEKKVEEKKVEEKPEELKADNKADDDFGDFNAEDIIESDGKLDFGDIEEIQKSDSEQGVIFKGNAVEDADLENMVSDMFLLGGEELKDELINVEGQDDYAKRMYQQRALEIGQREGEKGLFIPDTFFKQAAKEKASKGKFTKTFTNNIGDFGTRIEKFGSDLMGNSDLIKAMGVKSSIELLHVGNESLKSYVKKNYNYAGNDTNILTNYAALIAAKMQEQLIFYIPKEVNGELVYEPRYVPVDIKADKGSMLESQHKDHRRAGIRTEIALRADVPLELSERAGRAFREKNKLDTFGFAGIESLSDRLSNVKPSTDGRYLSFVNDFTSYFQAVERFAYKPLKQAQYTRLLTYVNEALDSVSSYIHGKKIKEERHRIARDAVRILTEQKRILTVVIEKGVLQDADNSVTFSQVFKAGKSLLKIADVPVQKQSEKTEEKTGQKTEQKTAEKKTTEKKAAPAIKVKINKKMEKEYLKAREKVAPEYKEAKLDEAYQKELRENLKTKKIDWAKDMAEGSDLTVNARSAFNMSNVDKEGYVIRQVLVTQMKQILKKYPDTTPDEVEATVNEYLRRLVTKSQYRFRVSSEAAKLILNSRYFSSKSKNTERYNNLVHKQYSENTKLTAHQSIAFGSLGGDTAKELGAYGGDVDFLAAYGKVSFKLNKDRMKGRVTFMAGNSMGMSKKDYGLIGYTDFYDLKHGRAAYIDDANGEAPDVTCCGDNFMAIYERARALKAKNWEGMDSAEHEAPHTIVDKPFQIYYEAHFHGTVGAAEIEEATMVMSERQGKPKWNFDRKGNWKQTVKDIKNDKEIKGMYDCINIINAHPEVYGRQGMEEMKLTLWDLSGNMVSYDELKQIFEGK